MDVIQLDTIKKNCIDDFNFKLESLESVKQPIQELRDQKMIEIIYNKLTPELSMPKVKLEEIQPYPYKE